jgi:hypothetical protein
MPCLRTADHAPMTRALVAAEAFVENPVVLVDVGSRGGVDLCWQNFGPALQIIGFEPDFIKLDTEGAEVEALQGTNMAPMLGIVSARGEGRAAVVPRAPRALRRA